MKQAHHVLVLLIALVAASGMSEEQGEASVRRIKSGVNFREPEREYQTVAMGGWSFEVEKSLLAEAPLVATNALKRLRENLDRAFRSLPKPAHPPLLDLKWFVLHGPKSPGGGYGNGLAYFAKDAPRPRRPVPVMHFHGTSDEFAPFKGGYGKGSFGGAEA